MPLTVAQQQALYDCAVGLYVAAPGVQYMTELATFVMNGNTIGQVYDALAQSPSFTGQRFGYTPVATDHQFAVAFVTDLSTWESMTPDVTLAAPLPQPPDAAPRGSTLTAESFATAVAFVEGQLAAGSSRGAAVKTTIETLDAMPHTDPNFGDAAMLFDYRTLLAQFYTETLSITTASITALQAYIRPIDPYHPPQPGTLVAHVETQLTDASGPLELVGIAG